MSAAGFVYLKSLVCFCWLQQPPYEWWWWWRRWWWMVLRCEVVKESWKEEAKCFFLRTQTWLYLRSDLSALLFLPDLQRSSSRCGLCVRIYVWSTQNTKNTFIWSCSNKVHAGLVDFTMYTFFSLASNKLAWLEPPTAGRRQQCKLENMS